MATKPPAFRLYDSPSTQHRPKHQGRVCGPFTHARGMDPRGYLTTTHPLSFAAPRPLGVVRPISAIPASVPPVRKVRERLDIK